MTQRSLAKRPVGAAWWLMILLGMFAWSGSPAWGQETAGSPESAAPQEGEQPSGEEGPSVEEAAREAAKDVASKVGDVAQAVDRDERAREATDSILNPIYQLAEFFSFSAFHWLAFALMVAGVVSFAGQLVLGKLVVLMHSHFSLMEILSDALGLAISLVGLVLTTQAATENSTFTQSPAAVLSATVAGAVVGFVCYVWGQSQEIKAARADRAQRKKDNRSS